MPAIETWEFLTNPWATRASPAAGGRALQRPAKKFRTGWRDQLGQRRFRLAVGVLDLQRMMFTANGLASRPTHTLQARVCSRIQVCGNEALSPPSHPLFKSLVPCLSFQAPTGPAAREATASTPTCSLHCICLANIIRNSLQCNTCSLTSIADLPGLPHADCTERTRSYNGAPRTQTRSGRSSVSRTSEARLARLEAILDSERQKRIEAEKEIQSLKAKVHGDGE